MLCFKNGTKLPFGVPMRTDHVDEKGNIYPPEEFRAWNESVTLLIDHSKIRFSFPEIYQ
jgi:hypothetical protein